MTLVEMFHPDLPAEQTIYVHERAVAHYRTSGWAPTSERSEAAKPAPAPPAAPVAAPSPAITHTTTSAAQPARTTTDRPRPTKSESEET